MENSKLIFCMDNNRRIDNANFNGSRTKISNSNGIFLIHLIWSALEGLFHTQKPEITMYTSHANRVLFRSESILFFYFRIHHFAVLYYVKCLTSDQKNFRSSHLYSNPDVVLRIEMVIVFIFPWNFNANTVLTKQAEIIEASIWLCMFEHLKALALLFVFICNCDECWLVNNKSSYLQMMWFFFYIQIVYFMWFDRRTFSSRNLSINSCNLILALSFIK
jgi:hypothetical protein